MAKKTKKKTTTKKAKAPCKKSCKKVCDSSKTTSCSYTKLEASEETNCVKDSTENKSLCQKLFGWLFLS